ncbi:ABC transporter permease [Paracoccus thiocyanatus]|uniref:ABC transporter permease n=2 Tax=Paracoccus thiocyanatus TaxID=34006 RepID=A0A3D8PB70_9RHOB|nr:ABC transporter permease [Paracoccus thiocyanatus]
MPAHLLRPALGLSLLVALGIAAAMLGEGAMRADFQSRFQPPTLAHPFGTDQLGRDMLARTLAGLGVSMQVGLAAAAISTVVAVLLALVAGLHRAADAAVSFVIDLFLGLPHLVLLVLLSFAFGGGTQAVILAVALTHWPRLGRVLRAELMQVQASDYVRTSYALGRSRGFVLIRHALPHLLPQALIGFILLFPHAILHEAGLTFLGFGLEPSRPAVGILLADAMKTLAAGRWWLALFPGLCLLGLVLAFDNIGNAVRRALDPRGARS